MLTFPYPDFDLTSEIPKGQVSFMKGDKAMMRPIMAMSDNQSRYNGPNGYTKPSAALTLLRETVMGPELFDRAFREYAQRWAFKHPKPADFFRSMEDASAVDLDWFWRGWFMSNAIMDISPESLRYTDNDPAKGAQLTLLDKGALLLPLPLRLSFADGHSETRLLPVEAWRYGPNVTVDLHTSTKLAKVELDPGHEIPLSDRGEVVPGTR